MKLFFLYIIFICLSTSLPKGKSWQILMVINAHSLLFKDKEQRTRVSRLYIHTFFFQLASGTANLNLEDADNLPPPPPELLQQQYLYGTMPDTRQQAIITHYAPSRGQGYPAYAPGSGQMDFGQPQQVGRISTMCFHACFIKNKISMI